MTITDSLLPDELHKNEADSLSPQTLKAWREVLLKHPMLADHLTEALKIDPKFRNNRLFEDMSFLLNVAVMGANYGVTSYYAFDNIALSLFFGIGGWGYNGFLGYSFSREAREAIWKLRWQVSNARDYLKEIRHHLSVGLPYGAGVAFSVCLAFYLAAQLAQVNLGVALVAFDDTEEGDLRFMHEALTSPECPPPLYSPWYIGTAIALLGLGLLVATQAAEELLTFFRRPIDGVFAALDPKARSIAWQQRFIALYAPLVQRKQQASKVKGIVDASRSYLNTAMSAYVHGDLDRDTYQQLSDEAVGKELLKSNGGRRETLLSQYPELNTWVRLSDALVDGTFSERELMEAVASSYAMYEEAHQSGRLRDIQQSLIQGRWQTVQKGLLALTLFSWMPFFENLFVKDLLYIFLIQALIVVAYISRYIAESNTITLMGIQDPTMLRRTGSYIYHYPDVVNAVQKRVKVLGPGALASTGTVMHLFVTEVANTLEPKMLRYLAALPSMCASGSFNAVSVRSLVYQRQTNAHLTDFYHHSNQQKYGRHAAVNKLMDVVELVLTLPRACDVNALLDYVQQAHEADDVSAVLAQPGAQLALTIEDVIDAMAMQRTRDARLTTGAAFLKALLYGTIIALCYTRYQASHIAAIYVFSAVIDWLFGAVARYLNAQDELPRSKYQSNNRHFLFQAFDKEGVKASLTPTVSCLIADGVCRVIPYLLAEKDIPEGLHAGPTPEFWLYLTLGLVNVSAGFQPEICQAAARPGIGR